MSKYETTPHRQRMLNDATMRPTKRNRRSKAQSVALEPLLLVYPDGGVWLGNRYYFATSGASRKGRNLAANPRCVVCPEDAAEAVIVEGIAELVTDRAAVERFSVAYSTKYEEEIDTDLF
jgi:Pyridoxamine 5'-phosphate oxidase